MTATLEDVAALAGVSRGTASRAVTGHPHVATATRERVLAAAASADAGLGVVLRRLPVGDREGLADLAADRRLAGLVLVNPTPEALDAIPAATLARTVTLGRARSDVASVDMDNVGGATAALRHLLAAGRRRIPAMVGPPSMPCSAERTAAYRELMTAAGLPPWVISSDPQRGPATGDRAG